MCFFESIEISKASNVKKFRYCCRFDVIEEHSMCITRGFGVLEGKKKLPTKKKTFPKSQKKNSHIFQFFCRRVINQWRQCKKWNLRTISMSVRSGELSKCFYFPFKCDGHTHLMPFSDIVIVISLCESIWCDFYIY